MHSISKNLKQIRQQRGWTQQQMADVLFVTRQTISNWENGKSMPDIDMLATIAEKLEVDVNVLLYGPQPVNNCSAEDIRKSLLILAVCVFLELNKHYISLLCQRTFSMFDSMLSIFITIPLICFVGARLVLQLSKGTGLVTNIPQINHGKIVQKIMLAVYLVPLITVMPYIIGQFAWFFHTFVGEVLGHQFSYNSKVIMPGLKTFGYMMQNITAFLNGTAFGRLSWSILMLISENSIIYNTILIVAGFIYELTKPFAGQVKFYSVFNFEKLIKFFNNPQNAVENFKNNYSAVKKQFIILAAVFTFCLFASCIIGKNNDGYIISQLNKGLLIPIVYVTAGMIAALALKTAGFINSGGYRKTHHIFTVLTIAIIFTSAAVYIPYLVKDMIVLADNPAISSINYLQKLINAPDRYKYIYNIIEKLVTGSFKNKFFVYSLPAFIAKITK